MSETRKKKKHQRIPDGGLVLSANLSSCIRNVANEIYHDLAAACAETGESMTNDDLIESILDADRMTISCGKEGKVADQEVAAFIDLYGYDAVLKDISRQHRFC